MTYAIISSLHFSLFARLAGFQALPLKGKPRGTIYLSLCVSLSLSLSRSVYPSIHLAIYRPLSLYVFVYVSISLSPFFFFSLSLSLSLYVSLSISLSVCLSVGLSVCLSASVSVLSVCPTPPVCLSVRWSVSITLPACLPACLRICRSLYIHGHTYTLIFINMSRYVCLFCLPALRIPRRRSCLDMEARRPLLRGSLGDGGSCRGLPTEFRASRLYPWGCTPGPRSPFGRVQRHLGRVGGLGRPFLGSRWRETEDCSREERLPTWALREAPIQKSRYA